MHPPSAWVGLPVGLCLVMTGLAIAIAMQPMGRQPLAWLRWTYAAGFAVLPLGALALWRLSGWRSRAGPWSSTPTIVGYTSTGLALAGLLAANEHLDRVRPDMAIARLLLWATLLVAGAGALSAAALTLGRASHWSAGLAGLVAAGVLALPAALIGTDFGKDSHGGFLDIDGLQLYGAFGLWWGTLLLLACCQWMGRMVSPRHAAATVTVHAIGSAAGIALAALLLLGTLPEQAELARRANAAPGAGALAILILLGCAWVARRRLR